MCNEHFWNKSHQIRCLPSLQLFFSFHRFPSSVLDLIRRREQKYSFFLFRVLQFFLLCGSCQARRKVAIFSFLSLSTRLILNVRALLLVSYREQNEIFLSIHEHHTRTFQGGVPKLFICTLSFSLSTPPLDLLRVVRCFFGTGLLGFILSFRSEERVVRLGTLRLLLRRFKTRCPLSFEIESLRFAELIDSASPLVEYLLERGWFLIQNSEKASWLLFDRRRAKGMVEIGLLRSS